MCLVGQGVVTVAAVDARGTGIGRGDGVQILLAFSTWIEVDGCDRGCGGSNGLLIRIRFAIDGHVIHAIAGQDCGGAGIRPGGGVQQGQRCGHGRGADKAHVNDLIVIAASIDSHDIDSGIRFKNGFFRGDVGKDVDGYGVIARIAENPLVGVSSNCGEDIVTRRTKNKFCATVGNLKEEGTTKEKNGPQQQRRSRPFHSNTSFRAAWYLLHQGF